MSDAGDTECGEDTEEDRLADASEFEVILEVFKKFDSDGSGRLERHELAQVLQALQPDVWSDETVEALLFSADRNADGSIQFEEFLTWLFASDAKKRRSLGAGKVGPNFNGQDSDAFTLTLGSSGLRTWPGTPFVTEARKTARDIDQFYDVGDLLGEGSYATVRRARNRATGGVFAVKSIIKNELSKMRRQGPSGQLAVEDLEVGGGGSGAATAIGTIECPDRRVARLQVDCTARNRGARRLSLRFRVLLRRGGEVLHSVEVFTISLKPDSAARKARTFPVRDALVFRARHGDTYEFACDVLGGGGAGDGDGAPAELAEGELCIQSFRASLFANLQSSEVGITLSLDHPNIVKIQDIFEDFRHLHFCMELCEGGELFDAVLDAGSLSEAQAASFMRQAFAGIGHMHSREVLHRDLSLENIMLYRPATSCPLERNVLKLIGLGMSRPIPPKGEFCRTRVGSAYYIAPEVLDLAYTEACDIWSLGVICYILLCGRPPFDSETEIGIWEKIHIGVWDFDGEDWERASEASKSFVASCLEKRPAKRPTSSAALGHPWLSQPFAARGGAADDAKARLSGKHMPSMRDFWRSSHLKKAAATAVAKLDPSKIGEIRDIFEALDADNSGELTVAELRLGLEAAGLGLGTGAEGWRSWMEKTFGSEGDADWGGRRINYTTFLASALDHKAFEQEDTCWAAFRTFDKDGSGTISTTELDEVLRGMGEEAVLGSDAAEALRRQADLNGDGHIDFYEFVQALRETQKPERAAECAATFSVTLLGAGKTDVGVQVSPYNDRRLCIHHLRRGGAGERWNQACAGDPQRESQQLLLGDEIVSVNGACGNLQLMLDQLQTGSFPKELCLSIVRWSKPPAEMKGERLMPVGVLA